MARTLSAVRAAEPDWRSTMKRIEAPAEPDTTVSTCQTPVTRRPRRTLRAMLIRLLEAWLMRLRPPCPMAVVALLAPPLAWDAERVPNHTDVVSAPVRSAWQWLGVIVVLVLTCAAAWGAWRRIETWEQ